MTTQTKGKNLSVRDVLEIEIEGLAKRCQDLFEESGQHTINPFDDFIDFWDFNERYEPGPLSYANRSDSQLVDMKVDLLMVYIEMKWRS